MASVRQIEANRRNALMSTGPRTQSGKARSRSNAVRHGLTAETVIAALEDAEDYKAFELSVTSDFDAQTAVERELVLRLASLLWRLRRAIAIETGLLQIQAEIQQAIKRQVRVRQNPVKEDAIKLARHFCHPLGCENARVNQSNNTEPRDYDLSTGDNVALGRSFLRLVNLNGGPFKRLNRYEAALWRQVGQVIVMLNAFSARA